MAWTYSRRVKYYETDRMGVVHHSNYLRLLEDARMEWVEQNVIRYSDLERKGVIIPFVESHGKFLSFLRFDDPFTVHINLISHTAVITISSARTGAAFRRKLPLSIPMIPILSLCPIADSPFPW